VLAPAAHPSGAPLIKGPGAIPLPSDPYPAPYTPSGPCPKSHMQEPPCLNGDGHVSTCDGA
jgi:hypothetical protein